MTIGRMQHALWMLNKLMSSMDICYPLDVKPPYILNILTCNRHCYYNKTCGYIENTQLPLNSDRIRVMSWNNVSYLELSLLTSVYILSTFSFLLYESYMYLSPGPSSFRGGLAMPD